MKLVIASRNEHKVTEIKAMLSGISDLEIVSLDGYAVPGIIEDQDTFLGNATKKAVETVKAIEENISLSGLTPPPTAPTSEIFSSMAKTPSEKPQLAKGNLFPGIAVLADDSGLMVDALDGVPGVYSARYAGEGATSQQLCEKLLHELKNVPLEKRTAQFTTVLVVAAPDGKILYTAKGVCEGVIIEEMRGTNGFGYDPVFYYPPLKKTFAELTPEEKNLHSHRYLALRDLLSKIIKIA